MNTPDIKELNLAYLFCLREFAKANPLEASIRFGVDRDVIDALAEATVDQIRALADPAFLQFKMRSPGNLREILKGNEQARSRAVVHMIAEA